MKAENNIQDNNTKVPTPKKRLPRKKKKLGNSGGKAG